MSQWPFHWWEMWIIICGIWVSFVILWLYLILSILMKIFVISGSISITISTFFLIFFGVNNLILLFRIIHKSSQTESKLNYETLLRKNPLRDENDDGKRKSKGENNFEFYQAQNLSLLPSYSENAINVHLYKHTHTHSQSLI